MFKLIMLTLFSIFAIIYGISLLSVASHGELFGRFTHKIFKWHLPNEKINIQGINELSTCKYCGKPIMKCHLDWFEY